MRVSVSVCLLYPPLPVFLHLSVFCAMLRSCVAVSRYACWVDIPGLFSNGITKSEAVLFLYWSQCSAFVFSVHMIFSVQCWCLRFLARELLKRMWSSFSLVNTILWSELK